MLRVSILMISSTGELGGGPNLMFLLGNKLNKKIDIYYAIPKTKNYRNILNSHNHIDIKERKLSFEDIIRIILFIKKNSINLIHAHGKGANLISRIIKLFVGIPIIYTYHGIHLKCHNKLNNLIYILYENIFGFLDNHKIFVSQSEKDYAIRSKIKIGNKYSIIHNGVSNKNCKKIFLFNSDNHKVKHKIKVISVARFVSQKNIKEILKIASILPGIKFEILGSGPLWSEINEEIKELNLKNVHLIGLSRNVFKYLQNADIYLSTSLYEGLPISVIEAMSLGLPIIASKVIGNIDTIEHKKSGFLYELGNIRMASKFIKLLADDIKLRIFMSENSYLRQKKFFTLDRMVHKHLEIYNSLI